MKVKGYESVESKKQRFLNSRLVHDRRPIRIGEAASFLSTQTQKCAYETATKLLQDLYRDGQLDAYVERNGMHHETYYMGKTSLRNLLKEKWVSGWVDGFNPLFNKWV